MNYQSVNVRINKFYNEYIASTDSINFEHCTLEDLNPTVALGSTPKDALLNLISRLNCTA
jgi:hypothetical protein